MTNGDVATIEPDSLLFNHHSPPFTCMTLCQFSLRPLLGQYRRRDVQALRQPLPFRRPARQVPSLPTRQSEPFEG